MQGIQGSNSNAGGFRIGSDNFQNALGPNGPGAQQAMQLLKQLQELLGLGQAQGEQGGGKPAQGAQGGGGQAQAAGESGGGSIKDILDKLREMMKTNPQGVMQALNQNPQLAQALGGIAAGNMGGGAGGIAAA